MLWKTVRDGAFIESDALTKAKAIADALHQTSGLDMKIVPLAPKHLNLSDETLPSTFNHVIADRSAMVFYGFKVNDSNAKWLEIKKGDEPLTELPVGDINNYDYNIGLHESYTVWGIWKNGENLVYAFKYIDTGTITTITAFLKGFAILPRGQTLVIQT